LDKGLSPTQRLWVELFGPERIPELDPEQVHRKVLGLPERQMETVCAYFGLMGLKPHSLREIASRLGVSVETVRSDLARALVWLKEHWNEEEEDFSGDPGPADEGPP